MIDFSPTIGCLSAALCEAQGAMKGAKKDSDNPYFKSRYADLESVWEAIRPHLHENGLSVAQGVATADGGVTVTTLLMHSSGEWVKSSVTMFPKDLTPQSVGSCATYGRRYGLAGLCGVVQTDDDGEYAQGRGSTPKPVLDDATKKLLEDAAASGKEAFLSAWKRIGAESRKAAESDKPWYESLTAPLRG